MVAGTRQKEALSGKAATSPREQPRLEAGRRNAAVSAGQTSSTASGAVVEVRPPLRTNQGPIAQKPSAPTEFFPLVSAAHEFKTPLVAMLGYTALLRGGRLGPITEKQQQVLGEIHESAERLHSLIEDLLLLYRLKADKQGTRPRSESVNANRQVREIFGYWAPLAIQKAIRYEFLPAPGDPWLRIDALKLQHIVSNLIENAIKFTPAGGRVIVSLTPCFWDRRRTQTGFLFNLERNHDRKIENAVRTDVCDTGPGIHADHHEEIFGDFVQLPGASSRGTGLGLAIARRLAENHGGAIWVESEPGKGSRFSLLLNRARYHEETKGHARQHTACG
jgi:two-component system, NarL family, sensor histidine kinase BarA